MGFRVFRFCLRSKDYVILFNSVVNTHAALITSWKRKVYGVTVIFAKAFQLRITILLSFSILIARPSPCVTPYGWEGWPDVGRKDRICYLTKREMGAQMLSVFITLIWESLSRTPKQVVCSCLTFYETSNKDSCGFLLHNL